MLEIETPPVDQTLEHCYHFWSGGLLCEQSSPRTAWTGTSEIPDDNGSQSGMFTWGCGAVSDRSLCPFTMSFRGTGSSDPDGDITSWSIDFGDGTSASGSWGTAPPTEVAHEYSNHYTQGNQCVGVFGYFTGVCVITLTVTDAAGESHSDGMVMVFLDQVPD